MRRRCHQQRARPRETVPHHRSGAGEHLIGHEKGQFRARGRRTDVFAAFQVIIAVNRALSRGDEAAEEDLLDLWVRRSRENDPRRCGRSRRRA